MTENQVKNTLKNGSTNRSLLAAMLVVYINEVVLYQQDTAGAGNAAQTFFGPDHRQRTKVVRAINANLGYYRKRFATPDKPHAVDPNFVHVGRKGIYRRVAWETLYAECRTLGRAGFFLNAWVQQRRATATPGSTVRVETLIGAMEKIMPDRLLKVIELLLEPSADPVDAGAAFLVEGLLSAGRQDLETLGRWLGPAPVLSAPIIQLADLDAWMAGDRRQPILAVETSPEAPPEQDQAEQEQPSATVPVSRRRRRPLLQWSLAALSFCFMCFMTAPLMMEDTRTMISRQGLTATYEYVLHKLTDSQLAGKDLRDSAFVLCLKGDVDSAIPLLEQVAYNTDYADKLRADCFLQLGRIAIEFNRDAIYFLEEAYGLYAKPGHRGWAVLDMALAYMMQGDYRQMELRLNEAIALREQSGVGNLAREKRLLSRLAVFQGRYRDALDQALGAYQIWGHSDDKLLHALFARELGLAYALNGDTLAARDYTNEAMYLYTEVEYPLGQDMVMANYILIYRVEGRTPPDYFQHLVDTLSKESTNFELLKELDFARELPL